MAAPGVDVVSTVPGGDYEAFSGTSMAAPHVSGMLALMLSAKAALRGDVAAATDAVRTTAIDILDDSCGGDEDGDPNNVYGDGRIDAKAAVDLVATGGTLAGTVSDSGSADPIAGASVTADDGDRQFSATTDENGDYDLFLAEGTYQVTVGAFGYAPAGVDDVAVVRDQTTDQDFALVALPRHDVTGFVRAAEDGSPIQGASVLAIGTPVPPAVSDATGAYTLTLPIGTYALRGSAGGCTEPQIVEDVTLTDDDIQVNFTLGRKLDAYGHGCHPDRPRLGRGDQRHGPLRQRLGRAPEPALPVPVLRRDLRPGLPVRQRLPELPDPGPVQPVPGLDPERGRPERGHLRAVA